MAQHVRPNPSDQGGLTPWDRRDQSLARGPIVAHGQILYGPQPRTLTVS